jgi:hypothetical protein
MDSDTDVRQGRPLVTAAAVLSDWRMLDSSTGAGP